MSLKKLLLIPLLVSLGLFIYFSSAVTDSFSRLLSAVHVTPALLVTLVVAIALQLIGHWIRAKKTTLLLAKVKESSVRFQFRALSIGYLFNTILPLRLGELIRARIISGAMTISFSYALVLIIFERVIDAMLLGVVGLLVILLFINGPQAALITYVLILLAVGALLLTGILLIMHQNRWVMRLWHRATALLNEDLKNSFRFKMWSVMYGLQQTIKPGLLKRYLALTVLAWLFYAGSLFVVVEYFVGCVSASDKTALTTAPYFGVAIPSGPANLGVFSETINKFTDFLHFNSTTAVSFNLIVWGVLVVPIALIGIVLLFGKTRETLWQTRSKRVSRNSLEHKLYRQEDISDEMKHFLENFFAGNSLSRIVHRLELSEGFRLVKYFKGGSDAITILALQDGEQVVKKIIPSEFEDRLKAQFDWLKKHEGDDGIVRVLSDQRADDYYSIDLDYDPQNEMFYEFIHRTQISRSKLVLDDVWKLLSKYVHTKPKPLKTYAAKRKQYIDKHITGCLEKAAAVDTDLIDAAEPETLWINGTEYDNLHQVLAKIKKHPQAWKDIATFRQTGVVHGDVIVDNLLVHKQTGKVLIIDPAPDGNIIEGPVFDFGKCLQSLYCGYETLLRDESKIKLYDGNRIDYHDGSSKKYGQLADYVRDELAPRYLSPEEQRAMLFHAAALFIRRLKHQVYYTPANVLKFYAVGVKTLNDFLAQYEEVPPKKAAKPTRRQTRKQPKRRPRR